MYAWEYRLLKNCVKYYRISYWLFFILQLKFSFNWQSLFFSPSLLYLLYSESFNMFSSKDIAFSMRNRLKREKFLFKHFYGIYFIRNVFKNPLSKSRKCKNQMALNTQDFRKDLAKAVCFINEYIFNLYSRILKFISFGARLKELEEYIFLRITKVVWEVKHLLFKTIYVFINY